MVEINIISIFFLLEYSKNEKIPLFSHYLLKGTPTNELGVYKFSPFFFVKEKTKIVCFKVYE